MSGESAQQEKRRRPSVVTALQHSRFWSAGQAVFRATPLSCPDHGADNPHRRVHPTELELGFRRWCAGRQRHKSATPVSALAEFVVFGVPFPRQFLKLCSSGLKLIYPLLQVGHFLSDPAQFCLVLAAR